MQPHRGDRRSRGAGMRRLACAWSLTARISCALGAAAWGPHARGAAPAGVPERAVDAGDRGASPREEWFRITLDGIAAGWQRASERTDGDLVRSGSESLLRVSRDGAVTEIRVTWELAESAGGAPRWCTVEQAAGGAVTRTRAEFRTDSVALRVSQGGRESVQSLPPLPDGCVGPAAAARHMQAARAGGQAQVRCMTIDPGSSLAPIEWTSTRDSTAACEGVGAGWRTVTSAMPVPTIECLDAEGDVLRAQTDMGIGRMVMTRTSKAQAQAALPAGGAAVDIIRRSTVALAAPADALLSASTARMRLRAGTGQMLDLPEGGAQRVERTAGGGEAVVSIDASRGSAAAGDGMGDPRFLAASPLVDAGDPAVRDAAAKALAQLAPGARDAARAEALRQFVHGHVTGKDLGSVFASASATVRDRTGDCTEHAVLLAAMLRASGIPSRLASGLVYAREFAGVRGCFAWHMWTQALVEGQWRDLDATISGRPFHAGHVLAATAAQEGAAIDPAFAGMVSMIGNLSIEVESIDGVLHEGASP